MKKSVSSARSFAASVSSPSSSSSSGESTSSATSSARSAVSPDANTTILVSCPVPAGNTTLSSTRFDGSLRSRSRRLMARSTVSRKFRGGASSSARETASTIVSSAIIHLRSAQELLLRVSETGVCLSHRNEAHDGLNSVETPAERSGGGGESTSVGVGVVDSPIESRRRSTVTASNRGESSRITPPRPRRTRRVAHSRPVRSPFGLTTLRPLRRTRRRTRRSRCVP